MLFQAKSMAAYAGRYSQRPQNISRNIAECLPLQGCLLLFQLQFHLFLACYAAPLYHHCWAFCNRILEQLDKSAAVCKQCNVKCMLHALFAGLQLMISR